METTGSYPFSGGGGGGVQALGDRRDRGGAQPDYCYSHKGTLRNYIGNYSSFYLAPVG